MQALTGGFVRNLRQSMNQRSYLDHNATSPLRAEVREAVVDALTIPGNPSSVHEEGRAALTRNRMM